MMLVYQPEEMLERDCQTSGANQRLGAATEVSSVTWLR